MNEAYFVLIGATLGGLIALITNYSTQNHNVRMMKIKLKTQKLEELFIVLSEIGIQQRYHLTRDIARLESIPDEMVKKNTLEHPIPYEKLQMLAGMYAPNQYKKITNLIYYCQEKLGPLSFKTITKDFSDINKYRNRLFSAYKKAQNDIKDIQSDLIKYASEYI